MSNDAHTSAAPRRADKLINNRILAALDESDLGNLMPCLESVTLSAGEVLHQAGEYNGHVHFPETAVVSHFYNSADGSTIEIAMVGDEGASGLCAVLGSPQPAMHHAVVTIGGNARRVKTGILRREIARGGKLQALFLSYANAHLAEVSQRVVCESSHPMQNRLCTWLLILRDRVKCSELPLTQELISQHVGVHRPTISVVAKHLRDQGLIDYTRGNFQITDRAGLEASACECYAVIRTAFSRFKGGDASGSHGGHCG